MIFIMYLWPTAILLLQPSKHWDNSHKLSYPAYIPSLQPFICILEYPIPGLSWGFNFIQTRLTYNINKGKSPECQTSFNYSLSSVPTDTMHQSTCFTRLQRGHWTGVDREPACEPYANGAAWCPASPLFSLSSPLTWGTAVSTAELPSFSQPENVITIASLVFCCVFFMSPMESPFAHHVMNRHPRH